MVSLWPVVRHLPTERQLRHLLLSGIRACATREADELDFEYDDLPCKAGLERVGIGLLDLWLNNRALAAFKGGTKRRMFEQ